MLFGAVLLLNLAGCLGHFREQVLYDRDGITVGLRVERILQRPSSNVNSHPTPLTDRDIQQLLGALEVTGYSGILVALFVQLEPIPVFSQEELRVIGPPMAEAFKIAGPNERVFFSIAKPGAPRYDRDRTAGSLFERNGYLHVVLTDHYAFSRAATGGGEERDPRDTKGMKLLVSRPAVAASLSKDSEPDWGPFETVHVSLSIQEVLAALNSPYHLNQKAGPAAVGEPAKTPSEPEMKTQVSEQTDSNDVLRSQIRELSGSNEDLRSRLDQQTRELERLRQEMRQLQQDLKQPKATRGQKTPPAKPSP